MTTHTLRGAAPLLTTLVFVLPAGRGKNWLLRQLGHNVSPSAHVGPNLVVGRVHFTIRATAVINVGNAFRSLKSVELDQGATIGQWNWISSSGELHGAAPEGGRLAMGAHSALVSRHYLDCTGGIEIGHHATMAGVRSTVFTHQIDYRTSTQTMRSVTVGAYCLVNSNNMILAGANVPKRSVTTMGAVLRPGLTEPGRLYGGVPARDLGPVTGDYFVREHGYVESVAERLEGDQ